MQTYSLGHLSDPGLLRGLDALDRQDRTTTAAQLAHLAEVDSRKLFVPAGYPSMFAYCVGERGYSDDVAAKRIQAARVARRFPEIFPALADGRLHLAAVGLLAPHLTEDTARELLVAAARKTRSEIERLLAVRFPRPDVLAWVESIPTASTPGSDEEHAPAHAECGHAMASVEGEHAPGHVDRSRMKPLSSQSFAVQFTLSESGHENLRYAQALLGHQVPAGDIAQVIERSLAVFVTHLEKTKFAATERPRAGQRDAPSGSRHIPAPVKRTVWERDGGQCTFVSESGHRCEADTDLEYDHITEFARGGEATVSGIRLRCRAHNQYEAERTFGTEFMRHKRLAAAEARAAAKERSAERARERAVEAARAQAAAADDAHVVEVVPWLRPLGFKAQESREAAELCRDMRGASLEERVRVALSYFRPRGTRRVLPWAAAGTTVPLTGVGAVATGP